MYAYIYIYGTYVCMYVYIYICPLGQKMAASTPGENVRSSCAVCVVEVAGEAGGGAPGPARSSCLRLLV